MTRAEYMIKHYGARWRTARKPFPCDSYWSRNGCKHVVQRGERYFDTGDLREAFSTYRTCAECANQIEIES